MGGRVGQDKSDMLTWRWGRGDNWIGEGHLYAYFLWNQNIPILKSLRDSWGVGGNYSKDDIADMGGGRGSKKGQILPM